MNAPTIFVSDIQTMLDALDANAVEHAQYGSPLSGLTIRRDARIPKGVWCLVPFGKTIVDEGVTVGACGEEYAGIARGFSIALENARNFLPLPERKSIVDMEQT